MNDAGAKVLGFPLLPRMRIRAIVERCPALGAVAAKLPPEDDVLRRGCELVLAKAFILLRHLPDVTREQADVILDHGKDAEAMTVEELAILCHDPGTAELYELWRLVWVEEDDPRLIAFGRYVVALIARLYRMECFAMRERLHDGDGVAARSA